MSAKLETLDSKNYFCDPCPAPSLSASIAKILLAQSPLHAWRAHPRLNPNYLRSEDSRMDLGSAAHSLLLERSADPIVWVDASDWRTNAAKEARDAARTAGKLPVLEKFRDVLRDMVTAAAIMIEKSELAGILNTGVPEQTLTWQEGAIWCRSRLDLLSGDKRIILDYKSTENAQPDAFIRQIGRMQYDVQAEFYNRGMQALGFKSTFIFLAQEISAPYACSLISLSNAYQELARMKVARAIGLWRKCMLEDSWPSYSRQVHYCDPPAWELSQLDQDEKPLTEFVP